MKFYPGTWIKVDIEQARMNMLHGQSREDFLRVYMPELIPLKSDIVIFGGNDYQCHAYLAKENIRRVDAMFLRSSQDLRGRRGKLKLVRVGTWYERKKLVWVVNKLIEAQFFLEVIDAEI